MSEKPDAAQFREILNNLKNRPWGACRWWPEFLFHHTDVVRAVRILGDGFLYSREKLETDDPDFSISSSDVNELTPAEWHNYVRLYFRPRTPTFFHVEGFRPRIQIRHRATQIMPIYLLLDLEKIICQEGVLFSDGNLAQIHSRGVRVSESATDFAALPFEVIYHDSGFSEGERDEIVCRRHAEVIVPHQLSTDFVRFIWCRSQAEYETLRSLLPSEVWTQWKQRVIISEKQLFFKRWIYVDTVHLSIESVVFSFNQCKKEDGGPFHLRAEFLEYKTDDIYVWEARDYFFDRDGSGNYRITIDLQTLKFPDYYRVTLYIDDCLAYQNVFIQVKDDLPF